MTFIKSSGKIGSRDRYRTYCELFLNGEGLAVRCEGLAGSAHVSAAARAVVEQEAWGCDDDQLLHKIVEISM